MNNEIWQVEVGGNIYEAPLAELPEWIDEGSLQPEDKVRKGKLRWIEARKVPALVPFFNAKANGEKIAVVRTITDASTPAPEPEQLDNVTVTRPAESVEAVPAAAIPQNAVARRRVEKGFCVNHGDAHAEFVCSSCEAELCRACPRTYGGSVRVCSECGSLCRPFEQVAAGGQTAAAFDRSEPFGFTDLGRAFRHPFKHGTSLVFGGLLFMVFTVGQSAAGFGGFMFLGAAFFCMLLANMLTFGVLAHTVENFVQGRLDSDFLPSFEDFSFWDDVIHPFFLSIGVYITSFGPFILTAIIGVYMIASATSQQMLKYQQELAQVPGTQYYSPDRTVEQSKEVREMLEKIRTQNDRNLNRQRELTEIYSRSGQNAGAPPADQLAEVSELEQNGTEHVDNGTARSPAAADGGLQGAVFNILRLAAPLAVIGALAFLWGLFYFPAACAVAGYTRSFMATINPMVGLDTIRRLGVDYLKILIMGFLLILVSGVAGLVVGVLCLPFALAGVGNLPATAIGSLVTFYVSVVFSCILGYALFKSADRLKLSR